MVHFIAYFIGAVAVLIQFASLQKAIDSMNYWELKKSVKDLGCDAIVFMIAITGGTGGFYIAVMSSFIITIYLNYFVTIDLSKPEPKWYVLLRHYGKKITKHF